jgi:hypothetical protein
VVKGTKFVPFEFHLRCIFSRLFGKICTNTRIAIVGIIVLVVGVALGIIVPVMGVAHDLNSVHPVIVGAACIVAGAVVTVIGVRKKKKNVPQEEKKKQANLDERDHEAIRLAKKYGSQRYSGYDEA